MGNYPDDVFCVNCGYQIYYDRDPLIIGLLMLERENKWNSQHDVHYGARLRNSPEYKMYGH